MSFSLILPFLRPIEHLILDDSVSEVMVNPSGDVFIEREGLMDHVDGVTVDPKYLQVAVKNIARLLGSDISEEKPILDARLPDGSRVAAVFAPCSVGGTTLAIRKFHNRWFSLPELVAGGSMSPEVGKLLSGAVSERRNILVSGGTGTGKTTLLNALAGLIPDEERIVVIEDTAEIQLNKPNLVRLEARVKSPSMPAVTIGDLVKASLRLRPDRLLVGEVRGGEAFDLLQALNTGHAGSLSTVHANTATSALTRLANCVLMSDVDLPLSAIKASIAESISLIVHLSKHGGKRMVGEIVQLAGIDDSSGRYHLETLYSLARRQ